MKKALIFPSCGGSGFGHIQRCIALATELTARGWQAPLVLSGRNADIAEQAGQTVIRAQRLVYQRPGAGQGGESPAYLFLPDGNLQVLRDGFTRPWRAWASVQEAVRITQSFRPDVLIGDLSLLTWMVGQRTGIPVVQLMKGIIHPAAPRINWWSSADYGARSPDVRPIFNPALALWGLPPIQRVEDLLRGDQYLVCGIPELEPLHGPVENTQYVGPILREPGAAAELPPLLQGPKRRPFVYVTFGGAAGARASQRYFQTLNQAVAGCDLDVVVSTGRRPGGAAQESAPANMHYFPWLPGQETLNRSDAVLFHGGPNTLMEAVRAGVPGLAIPFQSEQESYARCMETVGAGKMFSPLEDPAAVRLLQTRWLFGVYRTAIVPEFPLSPTRLRSALLEVLEDPRYRAGVQRLRESAEKYGGAKQAAEAIENMVMPSD